MAWIELHQTLPQNKKIMRLKRLLKIKTPQAIGHICMLWLWALDNAPGGDLSEFTAEDIAEVCEFSKDPEIFLKSLVECGFIDETKNSKTIHEWESYTGRLMEKREVQKEQAKMRQKRYRDRLKNGEKSADETPERNATVTRDNSVSNAHNSTVPNSTVPLYSGGDDIPRAREDDEDIPSLSETMEDHYAFMQQIAQLPPEVKARFYSTVDDLYHGMWGQAPTEYDYTQIYRLLRWIGCTADGGQLPFEMTQDDIELLSHSFEAAVLANKKSLAYVHGVFKRYKRRGIQTNEDFWDYEYSRDKSLGEIG